MSDQRDPGQPSEPHHEPVPPREDPTASRGDAEQAGPYGPASTTPPTPDATPPTSETAPPVFAAPGSTPPSNPPSAAAPPTYADPAPGTPGAPGTLPPGAQPPGTPPPGYGSPYVSGPAPVRRGSGLAIAALVVGIAAFLGAFIPILNYAVFVPALVAVVLGIVSLARRMGGKPLALTGLILGAVGFVLSIVLAIVYTFAFVGSVTDAVESTGIDPGDSGYTSPAPSDGTGDDGITALPGTSPDDPLPIGTPVTGDGVDGPEWEVTLGDPILDGTAAVLAADPTNEAPAEGMQYAIVPVVATYLGTATGDPLNELGLGFLAADGTQYSAADTFVVIPAPAFGDTADPVPPQGSVSGNVVVEIPIDGAVDGLWATVPGLLAEVFYFEAG